MKNIGKFHIFGKNRTVDMSLSDVGTTNGHGPDHVVIPTLTNIPFKGFQVRYLRITFTSFTIPPNFKIDLTIRK